MPNDPSSPGTEPAVIKIPVVHVNMAAEGQLLNQNFLFNAMHRPLAAVQASLAAGADLGATDEYGDNALLRAAFWNPREEVCRFLIDAGLPLDSTNREGYRSLHFFAQTGKLALAQLALKRGQPVDSVTSSGDTPLIVAAKRGRPAMVALLLKHGANPEIRDLFGACALHYAGEPAIIDLLLEAGFALECTNPDGQTPLMCASMNGKAEACAHLIARGARIDALDNNQGTALHVAAAAKQPRPCALLLAAGADPHTLNAELDNFASLARDNPELGGIYNAWLARRAMRGALDGVAPALRS